MWPFAHRPSKPVHLIVLAAVIALLGIFAYVYETAVEAVPGLPVTSEQAKEESTDITLYFTNTLLDPEVSCEKVFPVVRRVSATSPVGFLEIEELLKGPTAEEVANGYATNIPEGARLVDIGGGERMAWLMFDDALDRAVGGSCRVTAIRAQIENTIRDAYDDATMKVIISTDSKKPEEVLQP